MCFSTFLETFAFAVAFAYLRTVLRTYGIYLKKKLEHNHAEHVLENILSCFFCYISRLYIGPRGLGAGPNRTGPPGAGPSAGPGRGGGGAEPQWATAAAALPGGRIDRVGIYIGTKKRKNRRLKPLILSKAPTKAY